MSGGQRAKLPRPSDTDFSRGIRSLTIHRMRTPSRRDIVRLCSSLPTLSTGTPLHPTPITARLHLLMLKHEVNRDRGNHVMHVYVPMGTTPVSALDARIGCSPTQSAFQSSKRRIALVSPYYVSAAHPEDASYGWETHAD